ncbi:MAG: hypothetical protein JXX29_08970 [Deltaproteobacteria bacterium]|nr:hypothetical protein [Deltaproteobacteria bacterium]MBN2671793.1 hypothetical protein [Deltaproteobacteria bacterium]
MVAKRSSFLCYIIFPAWLLFELVVSPVAVAAENDLTHVDVPPAQKNDAPSFILGATEGVTLFLLPGTAVTNQSVRLIAVSQSESARYTLNVYNAAGTLLSPDRSDAFGVVPHATTVYFERLPESPEALPYRVDVIDEPTDAVILSASFSVVPAASLPPEKRIAYHNSRETWPVTADWSPALEDLFSVFVAKLFYVHPGASKGWRPLGTAMQDPYRNLLYGIMGFDEDNPDAKIPVELRPDCADAPMQVRAYFAWKLGLPVLGNECVRGTSVKGPWCYDRFSNLDGGRSGAVHPVARFNDFVATTLSWKTQAGVYRTLPEDDQSVVYPIALTKESIRPGTVFVDAGGHIILVTQWESQTPDTMGALYGVDAHPDFTVTHKGFFKGTFVFNHNVPTDGFKAFRPVVRKRGGLLRFLSNDEIRRQKETPVYSDSQALIDTNDQFYYRVQKALNPTRIEPEKMLQAKVDNLHRALTERLEAVQVAVDYMQNTHWATMEMPNGPAIFQTTGPWEAYSTPARDMRLFLTIDSVISFASEVAANPDLYVLPTGISMDTLLESLTQKMNAALLERTIEYTRSDGTAQTLRLSDIIERQQALEMAYNPNDCVELRWGAPPRSAEMESCTHHAPKAQYKKMLRFRQWFIDRRRPDQR